MQAYRAQDWAQCDELLTHLQHTAPATALYGLYAERVQGRDEKTNALVADALAEADARAAKDEALLRAFEGSGQAVDAFAAMYGLDPRAAAQVLERARHRRALATGL